MALRVRDLSRDDGTVYYHYRGKGGKTGRRELPNPAYAAIVRALAAWGRELTTMSPEDSLWPGRGSRGISSGTFYGRLQTYLAQAGLPPAGVHLFRHTAAKLRRDTGATIEEVSQFLDHSNLGVTSVYLRRLETPHDAGWADVAALLGVEHHASDRESRASVLGSTTRRATMIMKSPRQTTRRYGRFVSIYGHFVCNSPISS